MRPLRHSRKLFSYTTKMPTASERKFPFSEARTTGTECHALLTALLATWDIHEVSNSQDCSDFEAYIVRRGEPDAEGRVTMGMAVWLYQTGLYGPFHETDEGKVEYHGTLLTIELGARVSDIVQRAKTGLRMGVIMHEHIAAA